VNATCRSARPGFDTVKNFFRAIVEILAGEPQPFQGADSHKVLQCSACRLSLWAYNPTSGDAIAFVAEHGDPGKAGGPARASRPRLREVAQVTQWGFADA
jgi:hypothetical protein